MILERLAKERTKNLIIYLLQTIITEGFLATPYLLPHIATPPAKSVSNYYNLAHYNNGLIAIQLPHLPQRNKLMTQR
jgi:hypothetical protein